MCDQQMTLPPNWKELFENTVTLATYKLFPIDPNTSEYATIADLLSSTNISIEKNCKSNTLATICEYKKGHGQI